MSHTFNIDMKSVTPWSTDADLSSLYTDISDLTPARIESVRLDEDPVTGLDRLVVSLRLLDAR